MELETLKTERLLLKKLSPASFEYLFNHNSKEEVIQFLGLTGENDYLWEKEKSDGGYKTYDRTINAFLIILNDSGETIGRCGFHNWYTAHGKAEIGYVIFKEEHRKHGYMNEAMTAVIDYGFNSMNLTRIEACTSPNNAASIHILEKFGFEKEGRLRQHFVRNGILEDTLIFSLLRN